MSSAFTLAAQGGPHRSCSSTSASCHPSVDDELAKISSHDRVQQRQ